MVGVPGVQEDGGRVREWRPLHRGIITSDKLGSVDDAAFRLFMYLVVAQDDDGKYPWTRIKRSALVIGAGWDDNRTMKLGNDLVAAGLCEISDGMAQIVNGAEMQGKHRPDVKSFLYDRHETATLTPRARHVNDSGTLHNSTGHNSREQNTAAPGASAPAWLDRLAKHPVVAATAADQEWTSQIETDFSDVNLDLNAALFVDWWSESKKPLKRWRVAWRRWCEKAQKDISNGRSTQDRARTVVPLTGPTRPKSAGFPV